MTRTLIDRRTFVGAGAALMAGSRAVHAQAWPSRVVQILIGFGAGGVTDVATRLLAEGLRPLIGQSVVIENRAGASGMIAAGVVSRAAPDGHMLLGVPGTITIVPSIMQNLQIDVLKDLSPITIFATSPNVMIVKADHPARTLQEFIASVKAQPEGHFAYASSGLGTTVHIMAGMLERSTGIRMRHVPFRSSADSLRSVIAGELPLVFSSVNSALPFIQSGTVRALGLASEKRSSFLPDIPTFDEQGVTGMRSDTWFGLAGPAGMPRPLLEQIAGLCDKAMASEGMRARFEALGAEPLGLGPDAARAQMEREVKMFDELTTAMGIKPPR
ncbi:Bug family tripartite tricarboxylate transporter substrate binding protein [Phreatobacter sp.]|uniref:Bug family tripartite tricarboxylate transporter substrate binding protein n=1 Tax=Phreatobacter sp. TaxID=1966341 RepID=UPI003F70FB3E